MDTAIFIVLCLILAINVAILWLFINKTFTLNLPPVIQQAGMPNPANVPYLMQAAQNQPVENYEILQKAPDGGLYHHSWRHEGHRDINEFLRHKNFNVRRPDGELMK